MEKNKVNTSCTSRIILYIIGIVLVASLFYSFYNYNNQKIQNVTMSQLVTQVKNNEVKEITVNNNKLSVTLKNGGTEQTFKESDVSLVEYGINPTNTAIDIKDNSSSGLWINLLTTVLPILLIGVFVYFIFRSAASGNNRAMMFGKSTARLIGENGAHRTTFKDVAGLVESKLELTEVVDFLKNPTKFKKVGAEIPKGVLLIGPPGCGKTLLAKAVAGEAQVPFYSISGSEFVEMFVGVGASRVRDLFAKAKKNAPCIVFIDEIDAVGRQRGAGLGGSHDEREQTLNQILVEMDGFETDTNVIVVAATNRPDVLDPALLRPGRFDRRVAIDLPDKNERIDILKVHARNKPLEGNVDLVKLAERTPGFSGADLKNLLNEAAILAARDNKTTISMSEATEAIEKVLLGPERRSRILSTKEKEITAYHEAGHAIVTNLLPNCDPVHKISVISRGMALGYTWSLPSEDKHLRSRSEFEDQIAAMLGGRVAEKLIFNEITTGAENDLRESTKLARKMVTEYGMSEKLGPITFGEKEELVFLGKEIADRKNYSEEIAKEIDEEIRNIIENAFTKAEGILKTHKKIHHLVAQKLISEEAIDGDEFRKLFEPVIEERKTRIKKPNLKAI